MADSRCKCHADHVALKDRYTSQYTFVHSLLDVISHVLGQLLEELPEKARQ